MDRNLEKITSGIVAGLDGTLLVFNSFNGKLRFGTGKKIILGALGLR